MQYVVCGPSWSIRTPSHEGIPGARWPHPTHQGLRPLHANPVSPQFYIHMVPRATPRPAVTLGLLICTHPVGHAHYPPLPQPFCSLLLVVPCQANHSGGLHTATPIPGIGSVVWYCTRVPMWFGPNHMDHTGQRAVTDGLVHISCQHYMCSHLVVPQLLGANCGQPCSEGTLALLQSWLFPIESPANCRDVGLDSGLHPVPDPQNPAIPTSYLLYPVCSLSH